MNYRIRNEGNTKALYLEDASSGEFHFIASWNECVSDEEVIIPYALNEAFEIGKKARSAELRQLLGVN